MSVNTSASWAVAGLAALACTSCNDDGLFELDGGSVDDDELRGRWRIVGFESNGALPLSLTDRNQNVQLPGIGLTPGRVNGLMSITPERISFASALLFADHIFPDPAISEFEKAFQVDGGAAPGRLEEGVFVLAGSNIEYRFSQGQDDTIVQVDDRGSIITWERAEDLPETTSILAEGQAALFGATSPPPARPRFCLAWDLPGDDISTDADEPLDFVSGYAYFPVALTKAPNDALHPVGDHRIAIAHLLVYDDVDDNGIFEPSTDELRADSPVGLAYLEGEGPAEELVGTRYADLLPGWQYVHFHRDYSVGETGLAPYDPTVFVAPDILVAERALEQPVTDVIP